MLDVSLAASPSFRRINSALQRKVFRKRHWLKELGLEP